MESQIAGSPGQGVLLKLDDLSLLSQPYGKVKRTDAINCPVTSTCALWHSTLTEIHTLNKK